MKVGQSVELARVTAALVICDSCSAIRSSHEIAGMSLTGSIGSEGYAVPYLASSEISYESITHVFHVSP